MGGEQRAVLMYGPRVSKTAADWVELFKLVNKKKWVKDFLQKRKHSYEDGYDTNDEEGIDMVFFEEFDKNQAYKTLDKFLSKNGLSIAFGDNCCWDESFIGVKVKDFDKFDAAEQKKVNDLFEPYELKSTFYAGIVGEFE